MLTKLWHRYRAISGLIVTCLILILGNLLVWYAVFVEAGRDQLSVYFLDVGQADATLIESPDGQRLLIDAGRDSSILEPLFEHIPFYDRRIDVIIATHPHADHIGGIVDVLDHFQVDAVIVSGSGYDTRVHRELIQVIEDRQVDKIYARRGMVLTLGSEVAAAILFPDLNTRDLDPDMSSVWTQLIHGDNRFLFTGDAFSNIERYLVSLDGDRLKSDVFQAGHHGSNTSNSPEFLSVVRPDYVVVSAGQDSRYGHPHQEAIDSFQTVGAEILLTSEIGDIIFVSDAKIVDCLSC